MMYQVIVVKPDGSTMSMRADSFEYACELFSHACEILGYEVILMANKAASAVEAEAVQ